MRFVQTLLMVTGSLGVGLLFAGVMLSSITVLDHYQELDAGAITEYRDVQISIAALVIGAASLATSVALY